MSTHTNTTTINSSDMSNWKKERGKFLPPLTSSMVKYHVGDTLDVRISSVMSDIGLVVDFCDVNGNIFSGILFKHSSGSLIPSDGFLNGSNTETAKNSALTIRMANDRIAKEFRCLQIFKELHRTPSIPPVISTNNSIVNFFTSSSSSSSTTTTTTTVGTPTVNASATMNDMDIDMIEEHLRRKDLKQKALELNFDMFSVDCTNRCNFQFSDAVNDVNYIHSIIKEPIKNIINSTSSSILSDISSTITTNTTTTTTTTVNEKFDYLNQEIHFNNQLTKLLNENNSKRVEGDNLTNNADNVKLLTNSSILRQLRELNKCEEENENHIKKKEYLSKKLYEFITQLLSNQQSSNLTIKNEILTPDNNLDNSSQSNWNYYKNSSEYDSPMNGDQEDVSANYHNYDYDEDDDDMIDDHENNSCDDDKNDSDFILESERPKRGGRSKTEKKSSSLMATSSSTKRTGSRRKRTINDMNGTKEKISKGNDSDTIDNASDVSSIRSTNKRMKISKKVVKKKKNNKNHLETNMESTKSDLTENVKKSTSDPSIGKGQNQSMTNNVENENQVKYRYIVTNHNVKKPYAVERHDIVWGKIRGSPWWPARIRTLLTTDNICNGKAVLEWLPMMARYSEVDVSSSTVLPFLPFFRSKYRQSKAEEYRLAVDKGLIYSNEQYRCRNYNAEMNWMNFTKEEKDELYEYHQTMISKQKCSKKSDKNLLKQSTEILNFLEPTSSIVNPSVVNSSVVNSSVVNSSVVNSSVVNSSSQLQFPSPTELSTNSSTSITDSIITTTVGENGKISGDKQNRRKNRCPNRLDEISIDNLYRQYRTPFVPIVGQEK
ncbi:hypothetical protein SNEBB_001340 [Seison nebaliae]|nr:hypothetical protein SNEBB_001340 [Seison nebaliae]